MDFGSANAFDAMSQEEGGGNSPESLSSAFLPPSSSQDSPLLNGFVADEAQAFAENINQAKSEFKPPPTTTKSPLLDKTIARELQAFANDEDQARKRKRDDDIHGMRVSHSWLLLSLAIVWIFVILVVVLLQGFGQWFAPTILGDFNYLKFKLSDAVVIAFITSTTATVLGLYCISAYWLYGKPRQDADLSKGDDKVS